MRSVAPADAFKPVALAKNHLSVYYQVLNLNEQSSDAELERRYVEALEQCEEELRRFDEL